MKFDAIALLLLSSFAPNILGQVRAHVHDFGVPMCCQLQGSPSILEGIVVAIFSHDNDGLVWPRLHIVLLLL